jgi:hypothetical protein
VALSALLTHRLDYGWRHDYHIALPRVCCAHRTEDIVEEDGCALSPVAIHEFLTRVMYNRRTKGDPLWNTLVLGGMHNGARCARCFA